MGQRLIGTTILGGGLAAAAVVLAVDAGVAALVLAAMSSLTGLLLLRRVSVRLVPVPDDTPAAPAFATAIDDHGRPQPITRSEVDAVFGGLLDRWRGVQGLRLGDDADGPPTRLGAATAELRGDILRAEAYLDAVRFRQPDDRRPYDAVVAELEVLLRRVGDPDWGRRDRGGHQQFPNRL